MIGLELFVHFPPCKDMNMTCPYMGLNFSLFPEKTAFNLLQIVRSILIILRNYWINEIVKLRFHIN